jgi:hypothetical protein
LSFNNSPIEYGYFSIEFFITFIYIYIPYNGRNAKVAPTQLSVPLPPNADGSSEPCGVFILYADITVAPFCDARIKVYVAGAVTEDATESSSRNPQATITALFVTVVIDGGFGIPEVAVAIAGVEFHDQVKVEVWFVPICPLNLKFGRSLNVPPPVVPEQAVVDGEFAIVDAKLVVVLLNVPSEPTVASCEQASSIIFDAPSQLKGVLNITLCKPV